MARLKARLPFLLLSLLLVSCNNPDLNQKVLPKHGDSVTFNEQGFSYQIETTNNDGGVFYEVFIHQFADSNNDGIGDINGLISKLSYLKDLGVSALWLMPIHPSISDHKYDVMDYKAIDSQYGTMADFDNLLQQAKVLGIKIILDLVVNHSSHLHPWFIQAVNDYKNNNTALNSKKDYYNFSNTSKNGYAPTNGFYYEARFSPNMPDLNLDNPKVKEEIASITKFWLDKGVYGFRLDAVTSYYTGSDGENVEFLTWLNETVKQQKSDAFLVGEAWIESATPQYFDYFKSGMNFFNFPMTHSTSAGFKTQVVLERGAKLVDNLVVVENLKKERNIDISLTSFLSNHDQDRIQNGVSEFEMKLLSSAYLLTKGNPFMYYGEEIGLRGVRNANQNTDANRRMPMLWGEDETSLECNVLNGTTYSYDYGEGYGATSLINQETSLLNHYRKVISLRNKYSDFFLKGTMEAVQINGHEELASFRITQNNEDLLVIHNFSDAYSVFELGRSIKVLDSIDTYGYKPIVQNNFVAVAPFSTIIYNINN